MMIDLLQATLEKVDHFIDRIHAVQRSSLVPVDTGAALSAITERFQEHRRETEDLLKSPAADHVTANHCDLVAMELFHYLPYIGFLHRARHASNPFEMYGPLKRLAEQAIDPAVRLIISSEWEFSPLTYPSMGDISGFVLLGLPASEADNAFLVPLAGHEFGHPVWARQELTKQFRLPLARRLIAEMRIRWVDVQVELPFLTADSELETDARALRWWRPALDNAESQCQEVFCDLLGLRIFGESYCYAFSHLAAPGIGLSQVPWYPAVAARAVILRDAAAKFGMQVPAAFLDAFPSLPAKRDLLGTIVTATVADQISALVAAIEEYANEKGIPCPTDAGRRVCEHQLANASPVSTAATLPELLCAAWALKQQKSLWQSQAYLLEIRSRLLNELVLKSAEIMEYWHRDAAAA